MDLSNLKPAKGSTTPRKRIGRGVGSGLGGHSSTRGTKGQKSVSGYSIPAWFEGGQMPLQRRVPKFGFKNPFRTEYQAVNVGLLQALVSEGLLDPQRPVTPEVLVAAGVAGKKQLIKILGDGRLQTALDVTAHAFSASARTQIEGAGGHATVAK